MSKAAILVSNCRTGLILLGVAMCTPFINQYAERIAIELFYMGPK